LTRSEDEAWEVAAWDVYADMSGHIHHEKGSAAEPRFRIPDIKFPNRRCERIPHGESKRPMKKLTGNDIESADTVSWHGAL
jgi:hypothetical protein